MKAKIGFILFFLLGCLVGFLTSTIDFGGNALHMSRNFAIKVSAEKIGIHELLKRSLVLRPHVEIFDSHGGSFEVGADAIVSPDRSKVAWSNSINVLSIYDTKSGTIDPTVFPGDIITFEWVSNSSCRIVHTKGTNYINR